MTFTWVDARYFDGLSAQRRQVFVSLDVQNRRLIIHDCSGVEVDIWPLETLRRLRDDAGIGLVLCSGAVDLGEARLVLSNARAIAAIKAACPNLRKTTVAGRTWGKIALWLGASATALALMIFVIVPALAGRLAVFIPPEREARVGSAVLRQIERILSKEEAGVWRCTNPKGQAALEHMVQALQHGQEFPYAIQVGVVDHKMINAFALPGGHIIVMRGLIEMAETPEQLAAVMAHELGHVAQRDPIVHALRAAGTAGLLSLVLGDATGGTVLALIGEQLITAKNSRDVEARADDFALAQLAKAGVSPEALAEFFELLLHEMKDPDFGMGWISSHPPSAARAAHARAAVQTAQNYNKTVSSAEWQAIQQICAK
ncbi:M48 family metallopeptidase [uncultured Planktomarina sp.]|uniref:M48 family metallopeptidase n=1 Tax=uncultured Planktomarina sp. TaxID=1538529 RepID=UPI0032614BD2